MFDNQHYVTSGVCAEIPFELQLFMWNCIDRMPEPKDYFQVFRLKATGVLQKVTHTSEQPDYNMDYFIPCSNPITTKIYAIDDGDHSTMLLASEY